MARVLVVDTDVRVRDALTLSPGTSYDVHHARTGAEGLAILQREPFDLVILEYRLPDLSGLKLLAQIKAPQPRLPVIMITAHGSEWVCASAFKLGVRDYFMKPFDSADLVASIHFILSAVPRQKDERQNVLATNRTSNGFVSYQLPQRPSPIDLTARVIQQAARFIQEHYWEPISLPQVAQHVGMSKFILSRKFKAAMSVPFRRYLLQLRVMKARGLLQASQYSITEVAQMVGFSDLPRFDKVFRLFTGVPPSRYRARSRWRSKIDKSVATNY